MSAPNVLFPKGTVSRVDAGAFFAAIGKTRKMQSLRRACLASALHSEQTSGKTKSQGLYREVYKLNAQRIEDRRDLRGGRQQSNAMEPRETVPTSGSSSKYPSNQLARTPKSAAPPSPEGVRRSFPCESSSKEGMLAV
jgi:hypothetical protein